MKGEEKQEREGTLGQEIVVEGSGTLSLRRETLEGQREGRMLKGERKLQGSKRAGLLLTC